MKLLLTTVLVLTSLLLIVLILLHRGRGGGLSSMFGGAATASLSGSTVVEKNLNRLTVFAAIAWSATIIALGILLKAPDGPPS
ncbi:MAG: preprotein translocase subunit SecG [Geodermatophilaceae bacterium]|nr:preprotein translocase subunit SecG [Geodermatophilaceae bacterium]